MISTAFIKEQRHNRVKVRARKFQLMEKYYSAWKHKVQVKAEEKIEETGKEVNDRNRHYMSFLFKVPVCLPSSNAFLYLVTVFLQRVYCGKINSANLSLNVYLCPTHFAQVGERISNKNMTWCVLERKS